jgi:cytoskeletal protein CcmA (bactofilin family)
MRHLLAVLLLTLPAVGVSDRAVAQVSTGHEAAIKGEHTKQQFAAGYRVQIGANVADDVFAVGREVTIEGARAHAVYTVGDTIVVKDSTLRDLFAGGHGIEIHGTIEDDAMVAVCPVCPWGSGHLLLGPTGRIGDEARLMAGTLEIKGTIGGDLTAFARRIVISGTVAGQADLRAKKIVIASGARLGGELVARSPKKPEIAADATIAGPVREIEAEVNIPDPERGWRLGSLWLQSSFCCLACSCLAC